MNKGQTNHFCRPGQGRLWSWENRGSSPLGFRLPRIWWRWVSVTFLIDSIGAVLLFSCSGLTMTRRLKRQGWWFPFNQLLQIGRKPKIIWQASKKFSSWDLLLFSINFEHEQSVWDEQDCYHGYSAALLYFFRSHVLWVFLHFLKKT